MQNAAILSTFYNRKRAGWDVAGFTT